MTMVLVERQSECSSTALVERQPEDSSAAFRGGSPRIVALRWNIGWWRGGLRTDDSSSERGD